MNETISERIKEAEEEIKKIIMEKIPSEALNIVMVRAIIPKFVIYARNEKTIKYPIKEWKQRKKRAEWEISKVVRQLHSEGIKVDDIHIIHKVYVPERENLKLKDRFSVDLDVEV